MRARLARLCAELASDRRSLSARLDEIAALPVATGEAGAMARTALALHHAYCAVESILERVARDVEGDAPGAGADWHRQLLDSAAHELPGIRPALLEPATVSRLHELLAFRHFVRHAYAVPLDRQRLLDLQRRAGELRPHLETDLDRVEAWLEQILAKAEP